ncbi:MAG: arginine--tRNA ligase [Chloroflexota bacterium]
MLSRDAVSAAINAAVAEAQRRGTLPAAEVPTAPIERPQNPDHGDFATSLPLRLAKAMRMRPLEIAQAIGDCVEIGAPVGSVEVAPPGFINVRLDPAWLGAQVEGIVSAGEAWGNTDTGHGQTVQIEFVSVNPTGPVHVGHTRGAVLGSALASALEAAGYAVTREYYVNDAGTQMELFYESAYARYAQALGHDAELPENGYRGAYMVEVGRRLADEHGEHYLQMERHAGIAALGAVALEQMLAVIKTDLARIGVTFDVWFRERDLYADGRYEAAMKALEEGGHVIEREGARWFNSSALGEEKDNVLVRSTGQPTYFAADIAYHRDKLTGRGFGRVIDIWGADHQGHVSRMKAVLTALGIDPARLTVLIAQLVTLKQGGDIVRASKRTGQIITLGDLVDEVGADACRYFFLSRAAESQMDFDLELAKKESADNPVYYVQYGHARIAGILRQAAERGLAWESGDTGLLTHPAELGLVRKMLQLPEHIDSIATTLAPHVLAHYAVELATAFHAFYDNCRVLPSDDGEPSAALSAARLRLVEAAKVALGRTLRLMGMAAPESM